MATTRRLPGGVVPRGGGPPAGTPPADGGHPADDAHPRERAPFDPADRPLGMIAETWLPTEEPAAVRDELRLPLKAEPVRGGPSLTVWIIVVVFLAVVLLAVVSYRNAPP